MGRALVLGILESRGLVADLSEFPEDLVEPFLDELLSEHDRFAFRLPRVVPVLPGSGPAHLRHDDGSFAMLVAKGKDGLTHLVYAPESLRRWLDPEPEPRFGDGLRFALDRTVWLLAMLRDTLLGRPGCSRAWALSCIPACLSEGSRTLPGRQVDAEQFVRCVVRHEVAHLRDDEGQFDGTETDRVPLVSPYAYSDPGEAYAEAYAAGMVLLSCAWEAPRQPEAPAAGVPRAGASFGGSL